MPLGVLSKFMIGVEFSLEALLDSCTCSIEGGAVSTSFSTSDSDEQDLSLSFEVAKDFFLEFFSLCNEFTRTCVMVWNSELFLSCLPFHLWFSLFFIVKTSAGFDRYHRAHFCAPSMFR